MQTSFWVSKSPEESFDLIASADAMEVFQGKGLVPGISRVTPGGDILVQDSWGFYNKEKIVQVRRPELLVFRIEPNPMLRMFARSLSEEWRFEKHYGGTQIWRTFEWDQLLPFPEKPFRSAIEQNNLDLAKFIAHTSSPKRPLSLRSFEFRSSE